MKAVEFKTRLKDNVIRVPKSLKLSVNIDDRVIILFEEKENQDAVDFRNLVNEQFLAGYSESDSIYDNY
jgi:hypothetical protein